MPPSKKIMRDGLDVKEYYEEMKEKKGKRGRKKKRMKRSETASEPVIRMMK